MNPLRTDPCLTVTWSRSDIELCVVIRAERDRNTLCVSLTHADGVIGHPGLCGSFGDWRVLRRPGGMTLIKSCRAGFNDTLVSGRPAPRGSWEMDAWSGVRGDWGLHTAWVYILACTSQSWPYSEIYTLEITVYIKQHILTLFAYFNPFWYIGLHMRNHVSVSKWAITNMIWL